ncbi:hypothetical protein ACWZHB_04035 [Nocardia sp. FBN12]|uniref:hypothetical protein n=1 Tax=Nocardia sp. FBN12 TaxID=3419766 RepID=UPI003D0405DD
MRTARLAVTVSAWCVVGIVAGGCSSGEGDSTAAPAPTTTAQPTTTRAPAPIGDPLKVTCGQYTELDKASQLAVVKAIYSDEPSKNDDRVSMVDLMCSSSFVRDKPVKDAMPHQ